MTVNKMRKLTYEQAAACGENLKVRVTSEQSEKMQRAWFKAGKTWTDGASFVCGTDGAYMYLDEKLKVGDTERYFIDQKNQEIELIDDTPEHTIDELVKMRGVYFWVDFEQGDEFLRKFRAAGNKTSVCDSWNCYFIITDKGRLAWESESQSSNIIERLVKIKSTDELQPDFASQQDVWEWLGQGNKITDNVFVYGFKNGYMWNFTDNHKATHYSFCHTNFWQKYTPPKLIRVNGIEVPAPLESLDGLDKFWLVILTSKNKTDEISILHQSKDNIERWLGLGLCYANKQDAIARAEAMRKFEVVE